MSVVKPITEMQRNSAALVNEAMALKEPIYLTRRGQSAVVLMDAAEFDARMDLQSRLYEREMRSLDGIMRGHEEIAQGRGIPLEDVLAEMDETWSR